jgi:hypothetical protein
MRKELRMMEELQARTLFGTPGQRSEALGAMRRCGFFCGAGHLPR